GAAFANGLRARPRAARPPRSTAPAAPRPWQSFRPRPLGRRPGSRPDGPRTDTIPVCGTMYCFAWSLSLNGQGAHYFRECRALLPRGVLNPLLHSEEKRMKLYYSPGACSLSPHIVAREAGIHVQLQKVNTKDKTMEGGGDFWQVNARGYVPVL